MAHAGAWVGMYQIKIDGSVVYRCMGYCDATNEVYTACLPETTWERLTQHTLGVQKKGDIIEILCFFGAMVPYYPRALQYLGTETTSRMYTVC